jgi:hypothetical protein
MHAWNYDFCSLKNTKNSHEAGIMSFFAEGSQWLAGAGNRSGPFPLVLGVSNVCNKGSRTHA